MRIIIHALLTLTLAACGIGDDAETSSDDLSTGIADYTFFTCSTATEFNGEKLSYAVNHFNNTFAAIDLTADVPTSVREAAKGLDPGDGSKPLYTSVRAEARLVKGNTDKWTDDAYYTVVLSNKGAGKSIQVTDHRIRKTVSANNGFCTISCEGPTVLQGGRCIWTGVAPLDGIGNFVIETVAALPAGPLVRASGSLLTTKGAGIVIARPKVVSDGAPAPDVLSYQGDSALGRLEQLVRGHNPLAGTKAVGSGNCANAAITQALYLTTGIRACAVPYRTGADGFAENYLADARSVIPRSLEARGGEVSFSDLQNTLGYALEEGDLVMIRSVMKSSGKSVKDTGHVSLVAKVGGKLLHINNWEALSTPESKILEALGIEQSAAPLVTSLPRWGNTWAKTSKLGGSPSYEVVMQLGKLR
jgi:hypothetical protein